MKEIKKDISEIKKTLEGHSKILKEHSKKHLSHEKNFETLVQAIKENQKELQRQGVLAEERDHRIEQIYEALISHNEQHDVPPTKKDVSTKLENHENRISALEITVKEI